MYRSGITDINGAKPSDLEKARDNLLELADLVDIRYTIDGAYSRLPEGILGLLQAWSGDMLLATQYVPKAEDPSVLRYVWPPKTTRDRAGGMISNDCMSVLANAEHPVLAHVFINYVLDAKVALKNMGWLGYQPPQKALDPKNFVDDGLIPETPRVGGRRAGRLRDGPDHHAADAGARTSDGSRRGRGSSREVSGVSEPRRRARGRREALAVALACGPGRGLAGPALPGPALRGPRRGHGNAGSHLRRRAARVEPAGVGSRGVRDGLRRALHRAARHRLPAHARLRRGRHRSESAHRLPGRLLPRQARRPLPRVAVAAHHRPVLDQLPHADARVGEPALHGRLRQPGSDVRRHPRRAAGVAGRASTRPSSSASSTATCRS